MPVNTGEAVIFQARQPIAEFVKQEVQEHRMGSVSASFSTRCMRLCHDAQLSRGYGSSLTGLFDRTSVSQ